MHLSAKYFSIPTTFDPAITICKMRLYSEFPYSASPRIRTEYEDLLRFTNTFHAV